MKIPLLLALLALSSVANGAEKLIFEDNFDEASFQVFWCSDASTVAVSLRSIILQSRGGVFMV